MSLKKAVALPSLSMALVQCRHRRIVQRQVASSLVSSKATYSTRNSYLKPLDSPASKSASRASMARHSRARNLRTPLPQLNQRTPCLIRRETLGFLRRALHHLPSQKPLCRPHLAMLASPSVSRSHPRHRSHQKCRGSKTSNGHLIVVATRKNLRMKILVHLFPLQSLRKTKKPSPSTLLSRIYKKLKHKMSQWRQSHLSYIRHQF